MVAMNSPADSASDDSRTNDPQTNDAQLELDKAIDATAKAFMVAHVGDDDGQLAQALVLNSGRIAWRLREKGLEQSTKTSISDVVTNADRAAERFIATVLEGIRAEDGIVGEEGARSHSTSGRTWVIDPVDGTYNFASGSDYWCSALALVHGSTGDAADDATDHAGGEAPDHAGDGAAERIIAAAVHRPAMGYTWFSGATESGSMLPTTRDGEAVAKINDRPLGKACVGTYLHPTSMADESTRTAWHAVLSQAATLRMLGAGSVDLASVADGTLHAWMQHSVPAWDWLPGKALVEGAGGTTATHMAGGVRWHIAGNKQTVAEIVDILKGNNHD